MGPGHWPGAIWPLDSAAWAVGQEPSWIRDKAREAAPQGDERRSVAGSWATQKCSEELFIQEVVRGGVLVGWVVGTGGV